MARTIRPASVDALKRGDHGAPSETRKVTVGEIQFRGGWRNCAFASFGFFKSSRKRKRIPLPKHDKARQTRPSRAYGLAERLPPVAFRTSSSLGNASPSGCDHSAARDGLPDLPGGGRRSLGADESADAWGQPSLTLPTVPGVGQSTAVNVRNGESECVAGERRGRFVYKKLALSRFDRGRK